MVGLVLATIAVVAAATVVYLTADRDEVAAPATSSTTAGVTTSTTHPEPASIVAAVTYRDAEGRQVAVTGVAVTVTDEAGSAIASGRTDSAGTVILGVPDDGTYRVGVVTSTLPADVEIAAADAVRTVEVGGGAVARAAFGAVPVVPDTTEAPPATTTALPVGDLTGAESGLLFDVGMIVEWNLVSREVTFDRFQVCVFEGCWIDGPAITIEPGVVAPASLRLRNRNDRLRRYSLADDIEIFGIGDTGWLADACAGEETSEPPWERLTIEKVIEAPATIGAPEAYVLRFDPTGAVTRLRLITEC